MKNVTIGKTAIYTQEDRLNGEIVFSPMRTLKIESDDPKIVATAQPLYDSIIRDGVQSPATGYKLPSGAVYLVGGNQRAACAFKANLPCPVYIKGEGATQSDIERLEVMSNLTIIPQTKKEYADMVKNAMERGATIAEISQAWGVDQRTIEAWAGLNSLTNESIKNAVIDGKLALTSVNAIIKSNLPPDIKASVLENVKEGTTLEQAKELVKSARDALKTEQAKAIGNGDTLIKETTKLIRPVLSNARAESIREIILINIDLGMDDPTTTMLDMVFKYIFGQSEVNPLKSE